jgi:hypothetical protein
VGILGVIFLLVAGLLHLLWTGRSRDITEWRTKLERALEHGSHEVLDIWELHGLSFPVSEEKIQAALVQVRKKEKTLQRRRNLVIATFYILGTLFILFGYLLAIGVY